MNWQRNPDIKTTVLPDGFVALSTEKTDWVHVLNPIGALVWELSDGKLSKDEIVTQIKEIIQSSHVDGLQNEIEVFAGELLAAGALTST
jgi:hypothetical protein